MLIAFDAKRAYHNRRGLGNYSRDLVRLVTSYAPDNEYLLFNPRESGSLTLPYSDLVSEVLPSSVWRLAPSLWRSFGCVDDIRRLGVELYHGLSGELPFGIHRLPVKKIVTIHDAIFMRYPDNYSTCYRHLFLRKCRYACRTADIVIAISEQTRRDCIDYFGAAPEKIRVVYQGCNARFRQQLSRDELSACRQRYSLPEHYLLYVGAIEANKNLDNLIRAMSIARLQLPLLVVGHHSKYVGHITALARQEGVHLELRHDIPFADFPAVYQQADAFALMSFFEGFGIPVLEAVCSHIPVLASNRSCLDETGGDAAIYADPASPEDIARQLQRLLYDNELRTQLIANSYPQAERFTDLKIATNLINTYKQCF